MPIIETDLLYAYLHKGDEHHEIAKKLFKKIRRREIRPTPEVSALSIIELEILLKSGVVKMKGRTPTDQDIAEYFEELCDGLRIYSIPINSITCESVRLSAWIRAKYNLSYYDSHHAAQAQLRDQQIISADKVYDRVIEIKRIDPSSLSSQKEKLRR